MPSEVDIFKQVGKVVSFWNQTFSPQGDLTLKGPLGCRLPKRRGRLKNISFISLRLRVGLCCDGEQEIKS